MATTPYARPPPSIIWWNPDWSVIVIDVPRSIALAQGTKSHPCSDQIWSSRPVDEPFPIHNEPKPAKAQAIAQTQSRDETLHCDYRRLAGQALLELRSNMQQPYCSSRYHVLSEFNVGGKRQRNDDPESVDDSINGKVVSPPFLHGTTVMEETSGILTPHSSPCSVLDDGLTLECDPDQVTYTRNCGGLFVVNESNRRVSLLTTNNKDPTKASLEYRLPPRSTFFLSDCENSTQFRQNLRNQASDTGSRYRFDCIILDPPWPNRSVKRSHKTPGKTYRTLTSLRDIESLLIGMDLDMLLENDGYLGMWITNKPAVRSLVLDKGGLFDAWGVSLVEEWVWLKITQSGEPVLPLTGTARRPYEVFLIAKKVDPYVNRSCEKTSQIKRRIILGVPDLHSRKPCLKDLIGEILLLGNEDCRVLEVFARHLVAGWWSWGNECIKFNWQGHWKTGVNISPTIRKADIAAMSSEA